MVEKMDLFETNPTPSILRKNAVIIDSTPECQCHICRGSVALQALKTEDIHMFQTPMTLEGEQFS